MGLRGGQFPTAMYMCTWPHMHMFWAGAVHAQGTEGREEPACPSAQCSMVSAWQARLHSCLSTDAAREGGMDIPPQKT